MKAVFGLGNPGLRYALTRHKVGYAVIDLYRKEHSSTTKGRVANSALIYRLGDLLLIKPITYMNESGEAVKQVLLRFHISLADALIVYDDLDLPLGGMRILPKGGAGTHKGVRSILSSLGTEDIPRLRIGIGVEPRPQDTVDFVLGRFLPEEWTMIYPVLQRSAQVIETFRTSDITTVMNRFNRRGSALVNDERPTILYE